MLNNQFASLLPVAQSNINSEIQLTVDARQLHGALQVKTAFKDWIHRAVDAAGLEENHDYFQILEQSEMTDAQICASENTGFGMKQAKNFYFTLDAAKHIAMMARTDIGKQVRDYFIECEKQLRKSMPNFNDPVAAARAWADAEEKRILAEREAKEKQLALEQEQAAHEDTLAELGRAKQYRSCLAQGTTLSRWFNIRFVDYEGDSFYGNCGKLMTMLCNGGRCGKLYTKDARFNSTTFDMVKEHVPNSRFGYINAYDVKAWEYFFKLCEQFDPHEFPYVGTFAL